MKKYIILVVGVLGMALSVVAQEPLMEQFKLFAASHSKERVYLHMNQHYAQPGDRIWFHAFVIDDVTKALSDGSKVLYVNVVDEQGKVFLEEKISLNEGSGEGYLDIPDDARQGVYIIRAFTGWMRNFGEEFFFRDWLWINLQPSAIQSHTERKIEADISLTVYPEAHLSPVAGIAGRFAVKSSASGGLGVSVSGEVRDDRNNTVATFSTNRYGYGAFILKPESGRSYHLVAGGYAVQAAFPEVESQGISMLLTSAGEMVRITLQSKWGEQAGHVYRAILQSSGTVYLDQQLDLDAQPTRVLNIPVSSLSPGVYQLALLDAKGIEVGQRVFQMYPRTAVSTMSLPTKNLGRSEKLRVDLPPRAAAAYSVSVSDRIVEGGYDPILPETALFQSDLVDSEPIEMFYFYDANFRLPENWDLFALTKKHNAYDWAEILKYKFSYPKWPYEKYISAYGQVKNGEGYFLGQSLFTFYSFTHEEIIPARTDDNGWFLLPLFDFYGATNVIALADNKDVTFSGMRIDIESGLPPTDIEKELIRLAKENLPAFREQKRDKLVFKSSYKRLVPGLYPQRRETEDAREFAPLTRNTEDYVLDLREYLSFSSLREVFIEIGRGITTREKNGKRIIVMYDPVNSVPFADGALIFINGVPTIDYDLVLTLDPDVIETIKLYRSATSQERFGAMGRNGILSITTKDRVLEIPRQENISFEFDGFQPKEEFTNTSLSSQKANLPDLRHQLYWRAGSALPSYIEVATSDILSDYEVKMISIDKAGNWNTEKGNFSTLPAEVSERR